MLAEALSAKQEAGYLPLIVYFGMWVGYFCCLRGLLSDDAKVQAVRRLLISFLVVLLAMILLPPIAVTVR
jgi:hypothetical protein